MGATWALSRNILALSVVTALSPVFERQPLWGEADAIVREMRPEMPQSAVNFGDPESIRPVAREEK